MKNKKKIASDDQIDYKTIILATVAASGLLAIALIAPNCIKLFKPFFLKGNITRKKSYLKNRINKMIKDDLLHKNQGGFVSLTNKGERRLLLLQNKSKKNQKRWDGKWRIVIFDIKEKLRKQRDYFRTELYEYGFIRLQNSVWVTPYPCEEFVELLKTDLELKVDSVSFILAEHFDEEEKIKPIFGLS